MNIRNAAFVLIFPALIAGCSTSLEVRTNPSGADYVLKETGLKGLTDDDVDIPSSAFSSQAQIVETIEFKKDGYRTRTEDVTLVEGETNNTEPPVIDLEKLDSHLTISSSPSGAKVEFNLDESELPPDWESEFRTPETFRATSEEARELNGSLAIENVEMEGYRVVEMPGLDFSPGERNEVNVELSKLRTSLQVMTEPEGATVQDISDAGFGYLGETPLEHNFTWQDVERWAKRQEVDRRTGSFDTLELTLRISKKGYNDVFLKNIKIPIGQERSFKKSLSRRSEEIKFSSDPQGTHVYVQRKKVVREYDKEKDEIVSKKVTYEDHLGSTPFTYNMDPSNPLEHGQTLIWKKAGYETTTSEFAVDQSSFHMVLQPIKKEPR